MASHCHQRGRTVPATNAIIASPHLALPREQRPRRPPYSIGRERAQQADNDHADDNVGIADEGIGVPGEIADAVLAADNLAGEQGEPGYTHADSKAGSDARQRCRQHNMPENLEARCAQGLRGAHQNLGRLLDAVDGVEHDWKQRSQKGDVYDRGFLGRPHEDSQRNPGYGRNWPNDLDVWHDRAPRDPRTARDQAETNTEHCRDGISDQDTAETDDDIKIEPRFPEMMPKGGTNLIWRRHIIEADQPMRT